MNEARWGLMEMRQDMCESSHMGMFGEIQHTQDSSFPPHSDPKL